MILVSSKLKKSLKEALVTARKAKASGGTIIHAKGTGSKEAEKFMGVTLVPEKEMVFIVV